MEEIDAEFSYVDEKIKYLASAEKLDEERIYVSIKGDLDATVYAELYEFIFNRIIESLNLDIRIFLEAKTRFELVFIVEKAIPNKKRTTLKNINELIREIRNSNFYSKWRLNILDKKGKWCCMCDFEEGLEVHHKKPLSMIIKENDVRNLKEALECDELWDANNVEVLCRAHHIEQHKKHEIN